MAFDPSPDDRVTILANLSLCSLRGGNGRGALSYATMCRMARPHWPKACYRQGAAFMLQKVKKNIVTFFQASMVMTIELIFWLYLLTGL
jgi:hypothetical protein